MNESKKELKIASSKQVKSALKKIKKVDSEGILEHTLDMPGQIVEALKVAESYHVVDLPLDHSLVHLVGLGGSAISGQILLDMVEPKQVIEIHRGTSPPRDTCGVILSSYSGNTLETLEQSRIASGGLHTVIILTSGGQLEVLGDEWGVPVWKMPQGYKPRAAVGWSLGLLASAIERWKVTHGVLNHLSRAAQRLKGSLEQGELSEHPLICAALTMAETIVSKYTLILHSARCTGVAGRFAAQISENAKQTAFTVMMPEAMHNTVEGLGGANPDDWRLVCMSDQADSPSLRVAMNRTVDYFARIGFGCVSFPAAGNDQFELTLSRLFIADMTSLFIAGTRGIDPTPIEIITGLKETESTANSTTE